MLRRLLLPCSPFLFSFISRFYPRTLEFGVTLATSQGTRFRSRDYSNVCEHWNGREGEKLMDEREATYFSNYRSDANRDLWPTSCCPNQREREREIVFSETEITRVDYRGIRARDTERSTCWCPHEFVLSAGNWKAPVILTSCVERSNSSCQTDREWRTENGDNTVDFLPSLSPSENRTKPLLVSPVSKVLKRFYPSEDLRERATPANVVETACTCRVWKFSWILYEYYRWN